MKTIGVLALQGAFVEHASHIEKLGHCVRQVRVSSDLDGLNGLILPGGESTAIGKQLREGGLDSSIIEAFGKGLSIWGTCAGMILLAEKIVDQLDTHLGIMPIEVKRNAYGRQLGSFSKRYFVPCLGQNTTLPFIRAPFITAFHGDVTPLLEVDGKLVAARTQQLLVTSFHPELTEESYWHDYFVKEFCS